MANKDFELRMQGMLYALKIAKEGGIEALEKDIKRRGILNAPIKFSGKQLREYYEYVSKNVFENMFCAVAYTLYDSFGFGEKRLKRVQEEFKRNVSPVMDLDYMGQHYIRLRDYALELNRKYNLGIDINRIAACEDGQDQRDGRTRMCQTDRVLAVLREEGFTKAAEFLEKKLE